MTSVLREQLDPVQMLLVQETFAVFDRQGVWPVWAYLDHVLDAKGLVAADVLASLPVAGAHPGMMRYGLTWNNDNHWLPNDKTPLALTVAGMWQVGSAAAPLLTAFNHTLRFLIERERSITPSPTEVVVARATSHDVARRLSGPDPGGGLYGPAVDIFVRKVGELVEHEYYLRTEFARPDPDSERWEVRIPARIREFRDVTTIEDYIDTVERLATPAGPPAQPLTAAPLNIPYAVSFIDAVWESRTDYPLFARPDPGSIARLTQACENEGAFNSLMSALADVLSQVAKPGTTKAPRSGALEELRNYLRQHLDAAAAVRCSEAIGTLIKLRTIRHSIEHGDARAKAIAAYADLGLTFPIANWTQAWAHISALACGALDTLREEAHAGLHRAQRRAVSDVDSPSVRRNH